MSSGKTKENVNHIRFCGSGGMGVILTSIILGKAAIYDSKNAIQTQSYGPEQRGTRVKSDLVISDGELLPYPTDSKVDILVGFSKDAFDFYSTKVKANGMILFNSDLIVHTRNIKNSYKVPASSIAKELKNERVLNIVMLGSLVKITKIASLESIKKSIIDTVPQRFVEINLQAFNTGYDYLSID